MPKRRALVEDQKSRPVRVSAVSETADAGDTVGLDIGGG